MGLFGYHYTDLTDAQKLSRREYLDFYAFIAQISIPVFLKVFQLYYVYEWLRLRFGTEDDEDGSPGSPYRKAEMELGKAGWKRKVKMWSVKVRWWMGDEVPVPGAWGRKGEWVLGGAYLVWLLVLCFMRTSDDYMHFTKRFGIIAASQLPLHYLLAMKSKYSPLQLTLKLSHERLISGHKVVGQIIRILLSLHACFYLIFFAQNNLLANRIRDRDVILGLTCISIIHTTSSVAFSGIRKWNYRVFYAVHVVCGTLFLPLAFFHVHHIRPFIWETAATYLFKVGLRAWDTKRHFATFSMVPSTNLVQINIPLSGSTREYKPGQHIYLSLPANHPTIPNIFLHNPFTIASVPQKDGQILLIARTLKGTTKRLASFARAADLEGSDVPRSTPVKVEGPYGGISHLPDFRRFDRILLVAGGVGATFIIPLWREILDSKRSGDQLLRTDVRLVWAVRKASDTAWALPLPDVESTTVDAEVYLTGGSDALEPSDEIELAETNTLVDGDGEKSFQGQIKHRRPDLKEIVDETLEGHMRRVAVLVCGPASMARQMREEVRKWVWTGKDVYFHAEAFGL